MDFKCANTLGKSFIHISFQFQILPTRFFHRKWNCRTTNSYKQRCYSMQHVTSDHCDSEQTNRTRYNWLYATWFNLVGCWSWYWWLISCNNWAVKKICLSLCFIFIFLYQYINIYLYTNIMAQTGQTLHHNFNHQQHDVGRERIGSSPKRWVQQPILYAQDTTDGFVGNWPVCGPNS